jgi:hypothetical protein
VAEFFRGKSVAIVGSAPTVLRNRPGVIDAHDLVVRINNFKTKGFEDRVGRRTDVFYSFFGTSIKKPAADLIRDGVRLCMSKLPNARVMESAWHTRHGKEVGIDYRYVYRNRAGWWFGDTYVPDVAEFFRKFEALDRHQPTTGFAAILDVLSFDVTSVYLTGFDFFRSGMHNVDQPWRAKNLDDPIRHEPEREAAWIKQYVIDNPNRIILDDALREIL